MRIQCHLCGAMVSDTLSAKAEHAARKHPAVILPSLFALLVNPAEARERGRLASVETLRRVRRVIRDA